MIFVGADHRGFELKNRLFKRLSDEGYKVTDLGNNRLDLNDDYPDFALKVARATSENPENRGILLCGSGAGVDMTANKVEGARSALVFDVKRAIQARHDEDANIIALPADNLDEEFAWEIVEAFLETSFSGKQKDIRRIEKIKKIEEDKSSENS
jgi:ribose 5-phosphate isomerase B